MSLCIIDGYNFVFRAYHSLPPLTTSSGTPIGAVYGFINMIAKLIENNDCEMLAIALDSGRKTFRTALYKEYKAHRDEPDEELKIQFPIIREAIEAFGIKSIEVIGFEADDIIATYTKLALKEGFKTRVISSDKDLIQLMQDDVEIYNPLKRKLINKDSVQQKYGITPEQMVDYLSLVGDSSDNIPGVRKVGPKTAVELLSEFGTLENIYDHLDQVEPLRVRTLLEASKENAFLSKKLVTLKDDITPPYSLEQLKVNQPKQDVLANFLNKYEFKSLATQKSLHMHKSVGKAMNSVVSKTIILNELVGLKPRIEEYGKFYFHINNNILSCYFGEFLYDISLEKQLTLLLLEEDGDSRNDIIAIVKALSDIFQDSSVQKICMDRKQITDICPEYKFKAFYDLSLLYHTLHKDKQKIDLNTLLSLYNTDYKKHDAFTIFNLYKILRQQLVHERKLENLIVS